MRLQTKTAAVSVSRGLPMGAAPRFVISTDHLDSENDRILQAGLSFRDRMRVLFAHDSRALPVGVITAVHRFPSRTEATFAWIENDPDAARVRNVFEQNGLDASVGLRVEDAVPNDRGGYDIRKATVHEVSLTPTPANFHAIALTKALSHGRDDDGPVLVLRDTDEDRVLVIAEEEPRYTVDPVEVARLVRQRLDQVIGRQVAEEVRRQTRGLLGARRRRLSSGSRTRTARCTRSPGTCSRRPSRRRSSAM